MRPRTAVGDKRLRFVGIVLNPAFAALAADQLLDAASAAPAARTAPPDERHTLAAARGQAATALFSSSQTALGSVRSQARNDRAALWGAAPVADRRSAQSA
jgi:hypothetical protein